ncbi:MAG: phage holin family protein [Candidatus Spechtbacterales bacterium]
MAIIKVALKSAVNAFAVYIAAILINGVTLNIGEDTWEFVGAMALIGFVLWFGNSVLKPVIKVLTFPLILVTFGLFNVAINMFILWGAAEILPQLTIVGFLPLLWTTLIISLINGLLFFI